MNSILDEFKNKINSFTIPHVFSGQGKCGNDSENQNQDPK
jgi:hypothetical protein